MATDQENNKQRMIKLLERPGNGSCVDCGAADPEWASYTLGVFVCQSCSGLHRNISQISKVKSVLLDPWSDAEVEFMASNGNNAAKAKYEQKVPVFYYRPTHTDCQLLREQWIRARYERKEFPFSLSLSSHPSVLLNAPAFHTQRIMDFLRMNS
uniref:Arf-GAP domain-containing protein n=1 Tax=Oncorhynchus kisutch TaxID=8019 RepID=A0A8C7K9M7_ONCKI